jgi:PIN domain nuclease of toxin-antitoxin system
LPAAARDLLIRALDDAAIPCLLVPLDRSVADALETVSRGEVPDLLDRIVSATAVALGVPLISRDGKIRTSQAQTIWWTYSWQKEVSGRGTLSSKRLRAKLTFVQR